MLSCSARGASFWDWLLHTFPGFDTVFSTRDWVIGRFPAAFALIPVVPFPFFVLADCCSGFSSIVGTELCEPSYLDPSDESPSLGPTSEAAAEDCELDLRGSPGRRLEVADATKAVAFFFDL